MHDRAHRRRSMKFHRDKPSWVYFEFWYGTCQGKISKRGKIGEFYPFSTKKCYKYVLKMPWKAFNHGKDLDFLLESLLSNISTIPIPQTTEENFLRGLCRDLLHFSRKKNENSDKHADDWHQTINKRNTIDRK